MAEAVTAAANMAEFWPLPLLALSFIAVGFSKGNLKKSQQNIIFNQSNTNFIAFFIFVTKLLE